MLADVECDKSINRIRLEFKGPSIICTRSFSNCINRIRLEFKATAVDVLTTAINAVLIESDWNLKEVVIAGHKYQVNVLIESDWNLKMYLTSFFLLVFFSINRIRLEFKVS